MEKTNFFDVAQLKPSCLDSTVTKLLLWLLNTHHTLYKLLHQDQVLVLVTFPLK